MIYPYRCTSCDHTFEINRTYTEEFEIDRNPEKCPKCGDVAHRYIASSFVQEDPEEGYNPAFGTIVKSKKHKRELLAKMKGLGKEMEEIGNEPVDKLHAHYDNERARKMARRWEEV